MVANHLKATRGTDMEENIDIQRFRLEERRLEEELKLKARELELREKELELQHEQFEQSRKAKGFKAQIASPIGIAIIVGLIGLFGTAISGFLNVFVERGRQEASFLLEKKKQEAALIQKISEVPDEKQRALNVLFFAQGGYIDLSNSYLEFLRNKAGVKEGEQVPPPSTTLSVIQQFEPLSLIADLDSSGSKVIGFGHLLTADELKTSHVTIGGKSVDFGNGITKEQAQELLAEDTATISHAIDTMVKVELTPGQRDALADFIWNVGIGAFEGSKLLRALNEGKYDEVPVELRRWTRVGGVENPILLKRRNVEIQLWNKK